MLLVLDDDDLAELRTMLVRLLTAVDVGELEASPAHVAALAGAVATLDALQQTDV